MKDDEDRPRRPSRHRLPPWGDPEYAAYVDRLIHFLLTYDPQRCHYPAHRLPTDRFPGPPIDPSRWAA